MSITHLGPYDLVRCLGSGGMGVVWEAVHRDSGSVCALKVLNHRRARGARGALLDEARATAALDHPHIVRVYDCGIVPDDASESLSPGSAWVAMELAPDQTLRERLPTLGWADVHQVLTALLGALAHSHARGLVHRDLKPSNVLAFGAGVGVRWKLADFGLALHTRSHERTDDIERPVGTVAYMSPEQIRGAWRDIGPWTDLYGLGCVAVELVSRRVPHPGTTSAMLLGHLYCDIPGLSPVVPVPEGFEAWVQRLLRKRPEERFRYAADALTALESLGPSVPMPSSPSAGAPAATDVGTWTGSDTWTTGVREGQTWDVEADTVLANAADTTESGPIRPSSSTWSGPVVVPIAGAPEHVSEVEPMPVVRAALPARWGSADRLPRRLPLGTGLGLFGLRSPELVGRGRERDLLWEALRVVDVDRRPRLVALRGPAGSGKSRLARWLCERAHELAVAGTARAFFHPRPDQSAGLARMVRTILGTVGLDGERVRQRTQRLLGVVGQENPAEVDALCAAQTGLGRESERHGAIARMFRHAGRPVVVWLDDLHFSEDGMAFVRTVLRMRGVDPAPVVLVATLRDRPGVARWLADLPPEAVSVIELEPLDAPTQASLLRELLGLERGLAARVAERANGIPQVAVDLVAALVRADALVPGPLGFALADGADLSIPLEGAQLWRGRVEAFVAGLSADEVTALAIGAALCPAVDLEAWRRAAAAGGVSVDDALLGALFDAGLLMPGHERNIWVPVHPTVSDLLVAEGRARGVHEGANRLCAALFLDDPGRRGRHLLEAGDADVAADALLQAVMQARRAGALASVFLGFDNLVAALLAAGAPASDHRRILGWSERAYAHLEQGEADEAVGCAERAVALAEGQPDVAVLGRALCCLADVARRPEVVERAIEILEASGDDRGLAEARFRRVMGWVEAGDYEGAAAALPEIADALEEEGEAGEAARARTWLSDCYAATGDHRRALAALERALAHYELVNERGALGLGWLTRGYLLHRLGRAGAEHWYRRSRDAMVAICNVIGVARADNHIADLAREKGDLDAAEQGYRSALHLLAEAGEPVGIPLANLGLVLLQRGRVDEAAPVLGKAEAELSAAGRHLHATQVRAVWLPCAVHDDDAWSAAVEAVQAFLDRTGTDPDVGLACGIAADLAEAAGLTERAALARSWADKASPRGG